jgi:hypothetical protein
MPLTDGERRSLDEIERALQRDDPEFAATIDIDRLRVLRLRRLVIPALSFLLGTLLLVGGLVTTHEQLVVGVVIGVTGALIMAGALTLVLRRLAESR